MEKVIQLQGIGRVQATEAENIQVGAVLVWNQGVKAKVLDVKPRGKKQLVIKEEYQSGIYERVVSRSRLVAFAAL